MGSIPATNPDLSIKHPEYFAPKISDSYQSKIPTVIIRPFTIYGENGRKDQVIFKWINQYCNLSGYINKCYYDSYDKINFSKKPTTIYSNKKMLLKKNIVKYNFRQPIFVNFKIKFIKRNVSAILASYFS